MMSTSALGLLRETIHLRRKSNDLYEGLRPAHVMNVWTREDRGVHESRRAVDKVPTPAHSFVRAE